MSHGAYPFDRLVRIHATNAYNTPSFSLQARLPPPSLLHPTTSPRSRTSASSHLGLLGCCRRSRSRRARLHYSTDRLSSPNRRSHRITNAGLVELDHQSYLLRARCRKTLSGLDVERNGEQVRSGSSPCQQTSSKSADPYDRIAVAHRLNLPTDDAMPERETRRRLMWACYCIDVVATGRSPQLAQFPLNTIEIPLPIDERSYLLRLAAESQVFRLPWVPPTPAERAGHGMPSQGVMLFALSQSVIR